MNNDIEKAKEMLVYIIETNTLIGFNKLERQELAQTILLELEELKTRESYYKARYLEFNEGIVAGMKVIEERDKGENLC